MKRLSALLLSLAVSSVATAAIKLETTTQLGDETFEKTIVLDDDQEARYTQGKYTIEVNVQEDGDEAVINYQVIAKDADGNDKVMCKPTFRVKFGEAAELEYKKDERVDKMTFVATKM